MGAVAAGMDNEGCGSYPSLKYRHAKASSQQNSRALISCTSAPQTRRIRGQKSEASGFFSRKNKRPGVVVHLLFLEIRGHGFWFDVHPLSSRFGAEAPKQETPDPVALNNRPSC